VFEFDFESLNPQSSSHSEFPSDPILFRNEPIPEPLCYSVVSFLSPGGVAVAGRRNLISTSTLMSRVLSLFRFPADSSDLIT
jgi:hypothetical protein